VTAKEARKVYTLLDNMIAQGGPCSIADHIATVGIGRGAASIWYAAEVEGLIRPMQPEEGESLLRHKRATRSILIGLYLRELESEVWHGTSDVAEAIDSIAFDIYSIKGAYNEASRSFPHGKRFVPTPAGMEFLEAHGPLSPAKKVIGRGRA